MPGPLPSYLRSPEGILMLRPLRSAAQLLDTKAVGVRREKMYRIDDHIACAVAGITGEHSGAARGHRSVAL